MFLFSTVEIFELLKIERFIKNFMNYLLITSTVFFYHITMNLRLMIFKRYTEV